MTTWTGGYAHSAPQDSVMARSYPTLWTGGYIHGAPQDSITARSYPT